MFLRVQAIKSEAEGNKRSVTYSAAMAACEKAGQWELAVKLFDKVLMLLPMPPAWLSQEGVDRLP